MSWSKNRFSGCFWNSSFCFGYHVKGNEQHMKSGWLSSHVSLDANGGQKYELYIHYETLETQTTFNATPSYTYPPAMWEIFQIYLKEIDCAPESSCERNWEDVLPAKCQHQNTNMFTSTMLICWCLVGIHTILNNFKAICVKHLHILNELLNKTLSQLVLAHNVMSFCGGALAER